MRLVLDTGILISALITKGTPPDLVYQAWLKGKFELVTSEEQLSEFIRVAQYPKLNRYIKPSEAQQLVTGLRSTAAILHDIPEVNFSPDPDDNKIIATAMAGDANYIVSGDKKDLLSLEEVNGISIITARLMMETLAGDS